MDLVVATLLGVIVGGLIAWLISIFQRQSDREARVAERKYERLNAASRLIRISMWQATQLNFARTFVGVLLDVTSWGKWTPPWQPFAYTIADVGAALALVLDDVAGPVLDEYQSAVEAMLKAQKSNTAVVERYVNAALALRRQLEATARALR